MINAENPPVIFLNGRIVTLDPQDTIASGLAVRNGRILAVGSDEEIYKSRSSDTQTIDLRGKTMLPGFIDSHCHLGLATRSFRHYVDGRCPPNRSVADVLDRVRQRVKKTPKGEWIIVHSSMFGNLKLAEKRYPTKEELDLVAPEHPVVLLSSLHTYIVNSCALKLANITKETPESLGDCKIERDRVTGEPTGVLMECFQVLPIPLLSYEQTKESLRVDVREYWVKRGFTTAYSFASDAFELRAYQELLSERALPLRVRAMFDDTNNSGECLKGMTTLGILPGLGNDWLRIGGVKVYIDGALMGLSAATHDPYLNVPVEEYCGIVRCAPRLLNEIVCRAHNAGLQLCIHAMGDKAQEMALNAYENALSENPRSHRHRIEHFGCDMGGPELRRRAKSLGIVPVVTIGWLYAYGDFIEYHLGPLRSRESFALRSMVDEGLRPANGSDQCGTEPFTLDPFFSIWCAVTRQTFFGNEFVPEQAISVKEALRLWTVNSAYAGLEEKLKGSIEPGKLADLIVLSDDILSIPEERIKRILVDMTIIGGKVVYQR